MGLNINQSFMDWPESQRMADDPDKSLRQKGTHSISYSHTQGKFGIDIAALLLYLFISCAHFVHICAHTWMASTVK